MDPAQLVKLALQASIMLTVFGFGLGATGAPEPSADDVPPSRQA